MNSAFTATGTWHRPRIRRGLAQRIRAAWATFRAHPDGATNVTLEVFGGGGGGGGSTRITHLIGF